MSDSRTHPNLARIIHVDMDAFYASVEQLDNPDLRGKPVAVGGSRQRGVVMAASYEARKFGVKSAMPSSWAARRCPELIFVPARFSRYKEISMMIREIFLSWTDLVQPLSLDEAYLDVTENKRGVLLANEIAKEIKKEIKLKTGLTASAGVSFNKFLAKIASDFRKPDGLFVITPQRAPGFIDSLPVRKFHGVGPATAEKMEKLGILSGADLKTFSEQDLLKHFGKAGGYYFKICRGLDNRPVNPNSVRKSLSAERTFDENLTDPEIIKEELIKICGVTWQRAQKSSARGRTVVLKFRDGEFNTLSRSSTPGGYIDTEAQLSTALINLLDRIDDFSNGVRLMGVGITNLEGAEQEGNLKESRESRESKNKGPQLSLFPFDTEL